MRTTSKVNKLPFTKAVIDDISVSYGELLFTVVSSNFMGEKFRIAEPKNQAWKRSDAYTRNAPLAVEVIHYNGTGTNSSVEYARLVPNYEGE